MRSRTLAAAVTAAGLLLALAPPASAHPKPKTPAKITVGDKTYITDDQGRATQWRGFNVGDKEHRGAEAFKDITENDFRVMSSRGYNLARVLFFWDDLEETRGRYSRDYLKKMRRILDWAQKYDIKVMLDAHQDIYGPYFDDHRGMPEWTTRDEGLPYETVPGDWFAEYYTPGVQAAFDHLYNDDDLRKAHADMWMKVAATFGDHPAVLGYDLMNEPMGRFLPGETVPDDLPAAAGRIESTQITDMWNRLTDAIRLVDKKNWVFVEPTPIVGFGVPTALGKITDDKAAYAPHFYEAAMEVGADYDPDGGFIENYEAAISAYPAEHKMPVIVGEWGPVDQSLPNIPLMYQRITASMDRFASGWAHYTWCSGGGYCFNGADGKPKGNNTMLVQPYATAVSGAPLSYAYDTTSRTYTLTFTALEESRGTTDIRVPQDAYPQGYKVKIKGPGKATWEKCDERNDQIDVMTKIDGTYTVTISPE